MHTQEKNLMLSATMEHAQAEALRKKLYKQWLAENREAVNAYNEEVEAHGVFSDNMRCF